MEESISQKTINIINETADLIVANDRKITSKMYEIVFTKYPDLEKLFEGISQEQYKKLAQLISMYAVNIERIESLLPALKEISLVHVAKMVSPVQYPKIGMALIQAMEEVLGSKSLVKRNPNLSWGFF
ncbi:MAG: globin domain-containing protein [Sulfurimonas sp.]|nr:globin domain-containing protein [Sulfurimonas sp.]